MNRCIIKRRDGPSLKGGSCSEAERQESTFPPLAEAALASARTAAPEGSTKAAAPPCHRAPHPHEGPLAGYASATGCSNQLNSLCPRWKAKRSSRMRSTEMQTQGKIFLRLASPSG